MKLALCKKSTLPLPLPSRYLCLEKMIQTVGLLLGSPGCQQAVVMRAVSLGYEDILIPLLSLLPPLPAYGCHPCLCSHSLDSRSAVWVLAGGGGKTSLLQGWKQVLLVPQLTTEFLPFVGAVRITLSIHPTGQEQENSTCTAQGEQKEIPAQKCLSPAILNMTWLTLFSPGLLISIKFKSFVTAAAQN